MKFRAYNKEGKEKIFTALSLEDAIQKLNQIWKKWTDVYYCDYKNAKDAYKQ